jgi:hypothetical protein
MDEDGEGSDASAPFDRRGAGRAGADSDLADAALSDSLELLAADPGAAAAAAAYRAKRKALSVPVLSGGGGSSAKLGEQHLPLAHQLSLLLRHAVRAYPADADYAA